MDDDEKGFSIGVVELERVVEKDWNAEVDATVDMENGLDPGVIVEDDESDVEPKSDAPMSTGGTAGAFASGWDSEAGFPALGVVLVTLLPRSTLMLPSF